MAEITTHIFMAKEVQNKLNCNDSIKYFSVGPDAFFFSRKTRKLGYEMHRKKTFLFFKNSFISSMAFFLATGSFNK